jgi:hypothetical protein
MGPLQPDPGRAPVCGDAGDCEGARFRPLTLVCPRLRPRVDPDNRLADFCYVVRREVVGLLARPMKPMDWGRAGR